MVSWVPLPTKTYYYLFLITAAADVTWHEKRHWPARVADGWRRGQSWQDQSWVEYAWNVILSCDLCVCVWCHFCSSCLNFQVVFLSHLKTLALSMSSKHQELSCNPAQPNWFRNWMVSKTTAIYSNLYQCILDTIIAFLFARSIQLL